MKKGKASKTTKAKTGRPTKYSPAIVTKTRAYLDSCVDEYFDYHKTQGAKSDTYERKVRVKLPTIEGLALYLKVNKDTVLEWGKIHPAFSGALADLKAMQHERLIAGGLSGDYTPLIAKLVLSANHGMTDRTDHTSDGEKLPVPLLANAILNNDGNQEGSSPK